MMRHSKARLWTALTLLVFLGSTGCGAGSTGYVPPPADGCITGDGPLVVVTGTVLYQRLVLTTLGLGPALETRPARFIDVQVRIAGGGTCYGQGSADATGTYTVLVAPPAGSQVEVWAYSRTNNDALRLVTVHKALPPLSNTHTDADVFAYVSPAFAAGSAVPMDFTVPYNPGTSDRPSIGFGLLDVLLTCSESIRLATGTPPPLCHAYTRLGNAGATGTSWYSNASKALTLLGGASNNLDNSDTDYFDDGVIAHEYGHFLEYTLAHTLTRGGAHGGQPLEPGFAWSEGQATGFGCLHRGTAAYVDTWGTSNNGTLLSDSAENWVNGDANGIGGEETVAELVWDLGDGGTGPADTDGDAATVPMSGLLGAFFGFSPQQDAPYLGLLLDRLVAAGQIAVGTVTALMGFPLENQQITYPLTGNDIWPVPLSVPGSATGTCDSTSGNPCRGLASSTWYVFTLATSTSLAFGLQIAPIGVSGDNLDLYLLRVSGAQLGASVNGTSYPETIGPITLAAGTYLVRVEANCVGAGNNAGYTLTVSQ